MHEATITDATITEVLLDGRYRLRDVVGRGGMSTVYRADDERIERTVAIKLIRTHDDVTGSADRAHAEKAALASLDHRSLVTLFDSQLDPGRAQYLVLEFIDGPTLSSRLAEERMPPAEVAHIARDLAEGLDAVHAAGLVHRDVKPSNILLRPPQRPDDASTATLADFGIACGTGSPRLTSPGVVLGTVTYMAPEQLRGGELSGAVDVYALGLVLIEALTGKPGYACGNSIESALARLTVPPAMPDDVPPRWRELIERMTAFEPSKRPTAAEVAWAAAGLAGAASVGTATTDAAGEATETTAVLMPVAAPGVGPAPVRRRRGFVALAGVAVSALLIAGGILAIQPVASRDRVAAAPSARTAAEIVAVPQGSDPAVDAQPVTASEPQDSADTAGRHGAAPSHDNGKEPDHAHGPGGKGGNGEN
ncbi:serine/threonine-protein kinase [Streptomyces sp. AC495_CC817]|uniref:serine/threonine-protein kinase n=1 Tax=Streptomyces sp. AC495_CC817 TaxID=2823900 RepID=UPI001C27220E|nr:serine/threonine-protein kinase [Streptomyces sp. AC495_CC817]